MKVGVCVTFDSKEQIIEKIKMVVEEGFDNCQVISWKPEVWTDENAKFLKKLLAEYGVTASAFWCGWEGPQVWNLYDGPLTLGLVPRQYREIRVKNLCDGADFANGLPVGEYTINLFAEDSYNVIKSIDITVSAKTPAPTKSPATETPSASATPTATSAGNTNSYASDNVADKNASGDSSNIGLIASIIAVSVAVIVLVAAIVFAVKKSKKD